MKSGIRRIVDQKNGPPVPLGGMAFTKGRMFNLGAGRNDRENMLRQYGLNGTIHSIVSLLSESVADTKWRLYKKEKDNRRRYTTSDQGTDNRIEVLQHPAIKLWNNPNDFHSSFEFQEGSQQHEELVGETFWVMDMEISFPTSMWYVRPDRMEPVPDIQGYLAGWMYMGPNGEQIPLTNEEVIIEKRPDPLDPYRGLGPVGAIMPNIQQQRYATEYQRNLFMNGADPGGVITIPSKLSDKDFDELVDRWRESHRGISRAGTVGVLEQGALWTPNANTNKDLEYGNLRQTNRDEMREAWRVGKIMMGNSDDVNRAAAQTSEEVFVAWQKIPRLKRRRDTLNSKLLEKFGGNTKDVFEFDYDDPSPVNAENAAQELFNKAQAAQMFLAAGVEPDDVFETCGLPAMSMAEVKEAALTPPGPPSGQERQQQTADAKPDLTGDGSGFDNRSSYTLRNVKTSATKAIQQESEDFPSGAIAWMYHADWVGPIEVPVDHVEFDSNMMDGISPKKVQHFSDRIKSGKKLKPVILVKTSGSDKLQLADGHHRFLADEENGKNVLAFVGTVSDSETGWKNMHTQQVSRIKKPKNALENVKPLADLLLGSLNGHDLKVGR